MRRLAAASLCWAASPQPFDCWIEEVTRGDDGRLAWKELFGRKSGKKVQNAPGRDFVITTPITTTLELLRRVLRRGIYRARAAFWQGSGTLE